MFDGETFGAEMVGIVRGYVDRATAPLLKRIEQLEARSEAVPVKGDTGVGVAGALIDRSGVLILTLSDGTARGLGPVVGRDADPVDVKAIVDEVVAAIPVPQDGKDADMSAVQDLVDKAVAALPKEANDNPEGKTFDLTGAVLTADLIQQIETTASAAAKAALPSLPKAPTIDEVRPIIEEAAAKAVADQILTLPEIDMEEVERLIDHHVGEKIKAIPAPKDGQSVTQEDIRPLVEEAVTKAVGALPAAKDGVGLAGALIDRMGALVVTLTDGTTRDLGAVVGKDADAAEIGRLVKEAVDAIPKPRDGVDGFNLEAFEVTQTDERTIELSFTAGERKEIYQLAFPVLIDRGVWKEGQTYENGDGVTWAGSYWIAQKSTSSKPDSGDGFRLAVKRGRDGKDASQ